jgi:hypothetical protein
LKVIVLNLLNLLNLLNHLNLFNLLKRNILKQRYTPN